MTLGAPQKAELFSEVLTLLAKRADQVDGTEWLKAVKATLKNERSTDPVAAPPAYTVDDLVMPDTQSHVLTFGTFADRLALRSALEGSPSIEIDKLTPCLLSGMFGSPFHLIADQVSVELRIFSSGRLGIKDPIEVSKAFSRCVHAAEVVACPPETALLLALQPPKMRIGDKVHVLSETLSYASVQGGDVILTLERRGKDRYALYTTDVGPECRVMPGAFFAVVAADGK